MDRFFRVHGMRPRDDAKRQWGQSPEIEDSTESKDGPTTPRYAMSGFHIEKGGFQFAAATDARHRTSQRRHDMAAKTISNRIYPKHPKGLGKVRVSSVRERRSKK